MRERGKCRFHIVYRRWPQNLFSLQLLLIFFIRSIKITTNIRVILSIMPPSLLDQIPYLPKVSLTAPHLQDHVQLRPESGSAVSSQPRLAPSALSEAVAALNLPAQQEVVPQVDLQPLHDASQPTHDDSGYATASSYTATPESAGQQNPLQGTVAERTRLFQRKKIKLKQFNTEIPRHVWSRFEDFIELTRKPLNDWFLETELRYTPVAITLTCLGEGAEDAKPWIVVQSNKSALKNIKQILGQSHIQAQLTDDLSCPLKIFYCDRPPRLRTASDRSVWNFKTSQQPDTANLSNTFIFGDKTSGKVATIGGFVEVSTSASRSLYGLTAGHIIEDDWAPGSQPDKSGGVANTDEPALSGEDPLGDSDNEEYEIDVDAELEGDQQPGIPALASQRQVSSSVKSLIGTVRHTSYDNPSNGSCNLDWALVEFHVPALARGPFPFSVTSLIGTPAHRRVHICNCTSGQRSGLLRLFASYVAIGPAQRLTRVHSLTFDDGGGKELTRTKILVLILLRTEARRIRIVGSRRGSSVCIRTCRGL